MCTNVLYIDIDIDKIQICTHGHCTCLRPFVFVRPVLSSMLQVLISWRTLDILLHSASERCVFSRTA